MPGSRSSASAPPQLELDVLVELLEALLARHLGLAGTEQAFRSSLMAWSPSFSSSARSLRRASCKVL